MTIHLQTFACAACRESKPFESFYADRSRPDGKRPVCKPCDIKTRCERRRRASAAQEIARHLGMHRARQMLAAQPRDNIAAPVSISTAE